MASLCDLASFRENSCNTVDRFQLHQDVPTVLWAGAHRPQSRVARPILQVGIRPSFGKQLRVRRRKPAESVSKKKSSGRAFVPAMKPG